MYSKAAPLLSDYQIEWLLRDEVTSSLRHIYPVTAANLQLVADHVKESKGKVACVTETIPLKFVFGQEQSLPRFVQVGAMSS